MNTQPMSGSGEDSFFDALQDAFREAKSPEPTEAGAGVPDAPRSRGQASLPPGRRAPGDPPPARGLTARLDHHVVMIVGP